MTMCEKMYSKGLRFEGKEESSRSSTHLSCPAPHLRLLKPPPPTAIDRADLHAFCSCCSPHALPLSFQREVW
jgi:hypothetical protein